MKAIHKLVVIGLSSLLPATKEKLKTLVPQVVFCAEKPSSESELIQQIGNGDALLISPHFELNANVFKSCANLKYVGVYAKALNKIDVEFAKNHNIVVANNPVQSTMETAEFCIAMMLQVVRGLSPLHWGEPPNTLHGKQLGIVGFGSVGQALAKLASAMGMQVSYTSRSRKPEFENSAIQFKTLSELLQTSEFISLQISPNQNCLTKNDFEKMHNCKLLINTSLGSVIDMQAFQKWVTQKDKFAVFDDVAALECREILKKLPSVYLPNRPAWRTYESILRKDENLVKNLQEYLEA